MSDTAVYLKKQQSYDYERIKPAVRELLLSCGVDHLELKGKKVVIKPNLLRRASPDAAITTHPAIVRATAEVLRECGADSVCVCDSPAGPYIKAMVEEAYRSCGFEDAARKAGAQTVATDKSTLCEVEAGIEVPLLDLFTEADVLINLCKLKTHAMTGLTGAVKNMFGAVPGLQKAKLHGRFPEKRVFTTLLCRIAERVRPTISLVDGVIGMEGDGPSGGEPRAFGILAASCDPFALDRVMADFMGFAPGEALTVESAIALGLVPRDVSEIPVEGDTLEPIRDLKKARSVRPDFSERCPAFLRPIYTRIMRLLSSRPEIAKESCIGCGRCAEICPQQIIALENKKASIDASRCIRCFCCHEICPVKAIDIRRGVFRA